MGENSNQVVIDLEKIRSDLDEFKTQTAAKFKNVGKRFDQQDEKIKETKKQVVDLEKLVIIMVEQQKFANEKLTKIDGTSIFIRNSLIGGVITIIVSLIIRFSQ